MIHPPDLEIKYTTDNAWFAQYFEYPELGVGDTVKIYGKCDDQFSYGV